MQTVACCNVGLVAKNIGSSFSHVHQVEQAELASLVIEEEIYVRVGTRFIANG